MELADFFAIDRLSQHDEELHLTGDGSWDVRAIAAETAPAAGC